MLTSVVKPNLAVGIGAIIVSVFLAGAAVVQVRSAFLEAWALERGGNIPPEADMLADYEAGVSGNGYSAAAFGRYFTDIFSLSTAIGQRVTALGFAVASFETAVKHAPHDSLNWARLALSEYALSPQSDRWIAFVSLSYLLGSQELASFTVRSQLVLENWDRMPASLQSAAKREFRLVAERRNPLTLIRYIEGLKSEKARNQGEQLLRETVGSGKIERARKKYRSLMSQ
mgnify:CR=1 FL=1